MPKPRSIIRPTYVHINIPEDLRARLDLLLFSEVEHRVPYGAYGTYICNLIRRDLEKPNA